MDKAKLTHIYNLAFRQGANERDNAGLQKSADLELKIPPAPAEYDERVEQRAWSEGYEMGYKVGASDTELSSVEIPGAHGMVAGFGEEFLELLGFFARIQEN